MTLQDLGNVGEFLGAVAVLVSLIYLALQIRQNTTTVRAGTSAAISESLARVLEVIGSDPKTARLWIRGIGGDPSLDTEDVLQFGFLFGSYIRRVENAYYQQLRGFVDPQHWQTTERTLSTIMGPEGGRSSWERSRHIYSDRFAAYVDTCIAERDATSAAAQQGVAAGVLTPSRDGAW
jgi:hypothetical protein